jgi:hypothetical protein
MYDLANFTTNNMFEIIASIKKTGESAKSLEDAANKTTAFLFNRLVDGKTGQKNSVLIRIYKTHPYCELDPRLQAFACGIMGEAPPAPTTKCLTMMATAGIKPEWNSRDRSVGHQAIPLASVGFVEKAPMISQLIKQFGMDIPAVVAPDPRLIVDLSKTEFNVFHVAQAKGSPFIPAQNEFVVPHKVQSLVGFGGMLASGDIIAAIVFTSVAISKEVAERFRPLGPSLTALAAPFIRKNAVFS